MNITFDGKRALVTGAGKGTCKMYKYVAQIKRLCMIVTIREDTIIKQRVLNSYAFYKILTYIHH